MGALHLNVHVLVRQAGGDEKGTQKLAAVVNIDSDVVGVKAVRDKGEGEEALLFLKADFTAKFLKGG